MFRKKTIIVVSISKTTIGIAVCTSDGKEIMVKEKIERECTPSQYEVAFRAIKTKFHAKTIRILLPEDDTYLKLLVFPSGTDPTKEMVFAKAGEVIPEVLIDGYVDWKRVPLIVPGIGVQVFAVKKDVLAPLLEAAANAGMTIETVEPPSFAMARMAARVAEPFILVYPPVKPRYLFAIRSGSVMEVVSIDPLVSLEEAKHACVSYIEKKWGVTIRAIAINAPDPVVGLASKTEVQGEDMDVLNIPTTTKKQSTFRLPLPILIATIVLLVLAIIWFSIKLLGSTKTKSQTVSSQAQAVTNSAPTPTISMPVLERANLSLEVQNGSGEAGYAGKGKKVLEDVGYTNVTTANADSYEYTGVTVRGKTKEIATLVYEDLLKSYKSATISGALLDSASTVDAIVILGKE